MERQQIHITAEKENKAFLERASKYSGLTLSAFILSTCLREARKILEEKNGEKSLCND